MRKGSWAVLVVVMLFIALVFTGCVEIPSVAERSTPTPKPSSRPRANTAPHVMTASEYLTLGKGTGEIVEFGHYEQDRIDSNGAEPIQWIVLKTEEDKSLLISLYILDYQRFNGTSTTPTAATWETSSLREWLNDSFLNTAFTSEEQKLIKRTEVSEDGTVTKDKVFLLSYDEAWQYFRSAHYRRACGSKVVKAAGIFTSDAGMSSWWLRTETDDPLKTGTNTYKMVVNRDGDYKNAPRVNESEGVRPVIWIDNSAIQNDD